MSSSEEEEGVEIPFPSTIIPSEHDGKAIVTDVPIERGVRFGPFPGEATDDALAKNWMQFVVSVESFFESNLAVGFMGDRMYYQTSKMIPAGTELLLWGGKMKMHLLDPSKRPHFDDDKLTIICQDCGEMLKNVSVLCGHWGAYHYVKKPPEEKGKCPYCPVIEPRRKRYRKHVLTHGITKTLLN